MAFHAFLSTYTPRPHRMALKETHWPLLRWNSVLNGCLIWWRAVWGEYLIEKCRSPLPGFWFHIKEFSLLVCIGKYRSGKLSAYLMVSNRSRSIILCTLGRFLQWKHTRRRRGCSWSLTPWFKGTLWILHYIRIGYQISIMGPSPKSQNENVSHRSILNSQPKKYLDGARFEGTIKMFYGWKILGSLKKKSRKWINK